MKLIIINCSSDKTQYDLFSLSCVTWSAYHKNVLASADYGGIVSLWDASTGQRFKHFEVRKVLAIECFALWNLQ